MLKLDVRTKFVCDRHWFNSHKIGENPHKIGELVYFTWSRADLGIGNLVIIS